ncbi:MAG: hypothetical protein ACRDY0_11415, partial [Acidimicrobiales bacterium]
VAYGLVFAWLLIHRYRVEELEDRFERDGLAMAIASRHAEAGLDGAMEPVGAGPVERPVEQRPVEPRPLAPGAVGGAG